MGLLSMFNKYYCFKVVNKEFLKKMHWTLINIRIISAHWREINCVLNQQTLLVFRYSLLCLCFVTIKRLKKKQINLFVLMESICHLTCQSRRNSKMMKMFCIAFTTSGCFAIKSNIQMSFQQSFCMLNRQQRTAKTTVRIIIKIVNNRKS